VVGKDPVELEKYLEKKSLFLKKHFNFVQYIAAFISTVAKYYSSYVYSKVKLFLKKLFYVIIFHNHLHHKINNNKH
jgi:hypothetical protein